MIRYMPNLESALWSRKSLLYFDTLEEMTAFVVDQRNKFCRYIGKQIHFIHDDVELQPAKDHFYGWENYCRVIIGGILVGFCGE